ncbi:MULTISPECIES: PDGLE domain-containing protein [unclassified Methanoregula]|uniref:PDGLE domain-containing protein n=1 Tax=unclassified Methanoregula TaxID=2649730 RepID=UPI0009D53B20|nr:MULTISPECIES: PDGLE domain-containing protein [unclassified Methanoregula]OPX62811.1 MAG: cobalt transport protein CbiN [Methanoregula sp. PtaB.Bin085]OPY35248.1 MAG: cobalt transport protein CbiN [Methanoregula sp. PtaU1.Bin006]
MMDNKTFIIAGLVVALLIGVVAVFMASGDPDGLESTALVVQGQKELTGATPEDAEIHEDLTGKYSYESPMPDYSLGESLGSAGGIIAIVVGTILAFAVVLGISYGLKAAGKPAK